MDPPTGCVTLKSNSAAVEELRGRECSREMKDTMERTSDKEQKKERGRADEEQRSRRRKRDAVAPLRSCSREGGRPRLAWAAGSAVRRHTTGLNGRFVILQRLSAPEGLLRGTGVTTSGPPVSKLAALRSRDGSRWIGCYAGYKF